MSTRVDRKLTRGYSKWIHDSEEEQGLVEERVTLKTHQGRPVYRQRPGRRVVRVQGRDGLVRCSGKDEKTSEGTTPPEESVKVDIHSVSGKD